MASSVILKLYLILFVSCRSRTSHLCEYFKNLKQKEENPKRLDSSSDIEERERERMENGEWGLY